MLSLPTWVAFSFILESIPFPITTKQLHYLVTKEYLPLPEIPLEEIWDQFEQDAIAKIITCFQVGYLVLQCIGRASHGFAITTLELSALAIVV
ncbi:hypothetical protein MMC11_000097 [Xylographa trunciseda]|nr:hypothetical protein [Xylographa trunciseda]